MESPVSSVETLIEKLEAYTKTSLELAKLKSVTAAATVVTELISRLSVIVLVSLFVLVLNIGIALWLGELLGKIYFGFFIVAGFYLIAAAIMHFFLHKWLRWPVSKLIITKALQ